MKFIRNLTTLLTIILTLSACRKTQYERLEGYKYDLIAYSVSDVDRTDDIVHFSFKIEKLKPSTYEVQTTNSFGFKDNDTIPTAIGFYGERNYSDNMDLTISLGAMKKSYRKNQSWSGTANFHAELGIQSNPGFFSIDHKKEEFTMKFYHEIVKDNIGLLQSETYVFKRTKI